MFLLICQRTAAVRIERLELSRFTSLDPKSSAATNYAISAWSAVGPRIPAVTAHFIR